MYVTIRNYAGNAALADALVENEAEVRSLITGIDGFRSYYLVRTGDGAVSVSVYDSKDGADESTRVAGDWLRENLADLAVAAPDVSAGEAVLSF